MIDIVSGAVGMALDDEVCGCSNAHIQREGCGVRQNFNILNKDTLKLKRAMYPHHDVNNI